MTTALLAQLPPELTVVAVRDGRDSVIAVLPDQLFVAGGSDALVGLDRLGPGWWAGFASYDLGRAIERVSSHRAREPADALPDLVLARFPARAVVDGAGGGVTIVGAGPGRAMLERALRRSPVTPTGTAAGLPEDGWRSSLGRPDYEARVRAVLEAITAGDCYQVNLTRRLTSPRPADPVPLFAELERRNPAPHAALLRIDPSDAATTGLPRAVVSASPECFLRWRGRDVETRPIKGTGTDATTLRASAKDRAENVMIVDLARNDLGRVCEPGSIHVPALCALETHPGLHHLVSTVRGRLRDGIGVGTLLRAAFPPASVTGAPKPGVLQIIEDLEPVRRGVYCGAIGWIDTERDAGELAVAIRTFTVTTTATHLGVGAGIVADSRPAAEWVETELKAARLLAAAGATGGTAALAS